MKSSCFWRPVLNLIFGLALGILAAAYTDLSFVSWMRPLLFRRVSIVWLSVFLSFPFLIAAFAVLIKSFDLIYLLIFLRGFGYGFMAWCIVRLYGSAAWLMQPMLQFSDGACLAVLAGASIRWCHGHRDRWLWDLAFCLILVFIAVIVDDRLVSPFLALLPGK